MDLKAAFWQSTLQFITRHRRTHCHCSQYSFGFCSVVCSQKAQHVERVVVKSGTHFCAQCP
jgi:hypothetical protein